MNKYPVSISNEKKVLEEKQEVKKLFQMKYVEHNILRRRCNKLNNNNVAVDVSSSSTDTELKAKNAWRTAEQIRAL